VEALNLSRLAAVLGIQTPSLYNHVDGLPGLRRELALLGVRTLDEKLREAALGKSGEQALVAIAEAFRNFIKSNPGIYQLSLRSSGVENEATGHFDQELEAAERRVVEVGLVVIGSFGLEGEDALHAVRALRAIVHGFSTLEIAGGFGLPLDCDISFQRLVQLLVNDLKSR
jgi:AcrR family transcriptional regulator